MGYKKKVIRGVTFMGFLRFTTKALGLAEAIVLARILLPSEFGAYFVALIALGLLEVFTETGINIFLIQEKSIKKYLDSAWIVSIGRGILIGLVLYLLAPVISNFFRSQESLSLIRLISVAPVLRGFINPAIILLQKDLMFGKDALFRLFTVAVDTTFSITLTYLTKSPIGIVFGLLAGVLTELAISYLVVSVRPGLSFNRKQILEIFHRGKWVTAAGFFDYLYENIDNFFVGRMLGVGALGIYELGYALAVIPVSEVGKVFVHVSTPVMIKFSSDHKRLKKAFLKTLFGVSIISVPTALILIFFPYISVVFLGQGWEQITVILPLLAILGLVKSLSGVSSALFLSRKKQNYITVITFLSVLGLTVSIIPLINSYGIIGAAVAGIVGSLVALPAVIYFAVKLYKTT